MNFDFSEDERLLQQEVRRMLTGCCPLAQVREVLEGHAAFAARAWEQLITMGGAGAALPPSCGGSGLGALVLCLVAEEVGRHLAPLPLSSSFYLAAEAILRGGSDAQRQQWLPAIASGQMIATAAFDGEEGYLQSSPLSFDGHTLSGTVPVLPDGAVAQLAVLAAGPDLVAVELASAGVQRRALRTLDPTRPCAEVAFDRVPAARLEAGGNAAQVIARVLDGAAVLLAFEQIGLASRALEIARDYSLVRKAFGRQIGGFQALRHRMADMYTRIELARAHAYYGAWALSSDALELPRAAAAARVAATGASHFAAEECIEIHGGIGYTWEMDCHLYLRRARHLGQVIGSEHLWRTRLAQALIREAA